MQADVDFSVAVRESPLNLLSGPQFPERQLTDETLIPPSKSCEPPPISKFIPLLPEDERHVGNVLHMSKGAQKVLTEQQAQNYSRQHSQNVRGRCDGLLYDAQYPGFSPVLWEHVAMASAEQGSHRFLLESAKGGTHVVDVCYRHGKFLPAAVRQHTEFSLLKHSHVRVAERAVGLMVGVGDRLGFNGYLESFKVQDSHAHRQVQAGMYAAGECFASHFSGRNVGWEEMMSKQEALWPGKTGAKYPRCWFASNSYGGANHCDLDGDRSFAVWHSSGLGKSGPWWFLFPNHGLAVQIVDCTWISWDGRVTPHCTAVPYHVSPEECLFSLMCTLPGRLCHFIERKQHGLEQLQQQQSQSRTAACMFQQIREAYQVLGPAQKLHVLVREVLPAPAHMAGKKRALIRWGRQHVRFAKHVVLECDMSSVWVKDVNNSKCTQLSRHEVNNIVTWAE